MSTRSDMQESLTRALGASRVVPVDTSQPQGPLGLLALGEEIRSRLRSAGGRPTDPSWTARRCVPFKPDIWHRLSELARQMSTKDRKVTPAQVAAILVERGLEEAG